MCAAGKNRQFVITHDDEVCSHSQRRTSGES